MKKIIIKPRICPVCKVAVLAKCRQRCDGCCSPKAKRIRERLNQKKADGICTQCRKPRDRAGRYCTGCRQRQDEVMAEWKDRCIAAYGGVCECCGEHRKEFLNIDHVNDDGYELRSNPNLPGGRRCGKHLCKWLVRNGCPKDAFRLLCFNCNCARAMYGICPHQRKVANHAEH